MHNVFLILTELCAIGLVVGGIFVSDERLQRSSVWIERDRQRILGYQEDMQREGKERIGKFVKALYERCSIERFNKRWS